MALAMRLKQLIGTASTPRTFEVEKGQIRRFAAAIGEADPIHFDEQAAQAAGFATLVAPPTFATALITPEVFLADFGWDAQNVMHRAEEYEYFRPICAGDVLTIAHRISDVYEQQGPGDSSLVYAVIETRAHDQKDRPVFKGRRVLVRQVNS